MTDADDLERRLRGLRCRRAGQRARRPCAAAPAVAVAPGAPRPASALASAGGRRRGGGCRRCGRRRLVGARRPGHGALETTAEAVLVVGQVGSASTSARHPRRPRRSQAAPASGSAVPDVPAAGKGDLGRARRRSRRRCRHADHRAAVAPDQGRPCVRDGDAGHGQRQGSGRRVVLRAPLPGLRSPDRGRLPPAHLLARPCAGAPEPAGPGLSAGAGLVFANSLSLDFATGAANVLTVDNATHKMTVVSDGKVWGDVPGLLGLGPTPTKRGVKVIMEKGRNLMRGPGYYDPSVKFTQRLTYGGEYLHSAPRIMSPTTSRNIARGVNSSNGCTNLTPPIAKRLDSLRDRRRREVPQRRRTADGPGRRLRRLERAVAAVEDRRVVPAAALPADHVG